MRRVGVGGGWSRVVPGRLPPAGGRPASEAYRTCAMWMCECGSRLCPCSCMFVSASVSAMHPPRARARPAANSSSCRDSKALPTHEAARQNRP
eukprot:scaffold21269_cov119-Isochrysis_galbana.AAC.5